MPKLRTPHNPSLQPIESGAASPNAMSERKLTERRSSERSRRPRVSIGKRSAAETKIGELGLSTTIGSETRRITIRTLVTPRNAMRLGASSAESTASEAIGITEIAIGSARPIEIQAGGRALARARRRA